ncbi:glycosyl hydrolase family 76-domain-containing protein [Dipodascopsis tothii]|uniref:glycosyl hydrolase family 76-domain-containing protein n=1 Tax=Dipodascopsis tothii TaxID=44089 RepID=UPI0034CE39FB
MAAHVQAVSLDVYDQGKWPGGVWLTAASIKAAAATVASGLMNYYHGNESGYTPGVFTGGYYWWESGAAWGSMIDYWYYTGDDTWNDLCKQGMLFQVGENDNYEPANQTLSLGNDDQGFWGISAMEAAERNFTNPDSDDPQWLALAQAVFNSIALVWDTNYCGGGVRWQKFTFNNGYDYKNSISNGVLFQLGARLARYTGNDSYADWANKVWDWMSDENLYNQTYSFVYDGAYVTDNCSAVNQVQWTYNAGVMMAGAAYMYNYTVETNGTTDSAEAQLWKSRLDGFVSSLSIFFFNKVMYEPACEPSGSCNTDERSFKAYLSRWIGATMQLADYTRDTLYPYIATSAAAAAQTCVGGSDGVTCGFTWLQSGWDGNYGLGEQMCALEVIQALLVNATASPYTETTGGTSPGDAAAGTSGSTSSSKKSSTTTRKDKIEASIITAVVVLFLSVLAVWLVLEDRSPEEKLQARRRGWLRVSA